jgi:hypothetical protein
MGAKEMKKFMLCFVIVIVNGILIGMASRIVANVYHVGPGSLAEAVMSIVSMTYFMGLGFHVGNKLL